MFMNKVTMQKYVLGFMTDGNGNIAFIIKNKPEWQKGFKNGIGGKIEEGETSLEAMIREFQEETSVLTTKGEWANYAKMTNSKFEIDVFLGIIDEERFDQIMTNTDEVVVKHSINYTLDFPEEFIDNIPWLLMMIMDQAALRGPIVVQYPEF